MSGSEPSPFSVAVEEQPGAARLVVRGELDLATAPELDAALLPRVRAGEHCLLDLRELEFMDSSGVRIIVAAHLAAQDGEGTFELLALPDGHPVRRVLEVSGLESVLHVVADA